MAKATRKRSRPAKSVEKPAVRKRKRPVKAATKEVQGPAWRTSEDMPMSWPNGSAFMRGPHSKKYKNYRRKMGTPDEENPNLLGRIVNDRTNIDPGYRTWRWLGGKYYFIDTFDTFSKAAECLSRKDAGK